MYHVFIMAYHLPFYIHARKLVLSMDHTKRVNPWVFYASGKRKLKDAADESHQFRKPVRVSVLFLFLQLRLILSDRTPIVGARS
jgi:hypothetical protein